MKHIVPLAVCVALALAALSGCASAPTSTPVPPTTPPPTPSPKPGQTVAEGKVRIYYEGNAQVELIAPSGRRVLIDVYSPTTLSGAPSAEDILLTTHTHPDHVNAAFLKSFPGQQLYTKAGSIALADVTIQGIAAGHNAGDTPQPENGSDYFYVVAMGGLRIAHFGDIGQDALTDAQLAALGRVDIAITQFDNSYSSMNVSNKKGFNLMAQVKPRLIIPTHNSQNAAKMAGETWPALYAVTASISIGPSDLSDATRILFLGSTAQAYGDLTKGTKVAW